MWYLPGSVWKASTGIPTSSDPIRLELENMSTLHASCLVSFMLRSFLTMLSTLALGAV